MIQEEEARREDETGPEAGTAPETAAGAEQAAPPPPEDSAEAVAAARAEAEAQRELCLRTAAELENVRRRAERDVQNAHRYGAERLARDLLPVKDSMEMGLAAAAENEAGDPDDDGVAAGFRATLKLLTQCLEQHGIGEIDPLGEAFDPELHEAMATQPSSEAAPDSVLMVVQKGYRMHERLLRPARVIVARSPDA